MVSAEETAQLEKEWGRWRGEWTRRRKIFKTYVGKTWSNFESSGLWFLLMESGGQVLGIGDGCADATAGDGAGRGPGRRVGHGGARWAGEGRAVLACECAGQASTVTTAEPTWHVFTADEGSEGLSCVHGMDTRYGRLRVVRAQANYRRAPGVAVARGAGYLRSANLFIY